MRKIDDFTNSEKIAFLLADEIKKLFGAEFVAVIEYTYAKTDILAAIPSKQLDKEHFSPHELFYILKSLQREKLDRIKNGDIQSEHLKKYFPVFNYEEYTIITVYTDENRIITLEIYGEIKSILYKG